MMSQTTQEILLGGHVPHDDLAALIKAFKIPPATEPLMLLEMQPRSLVEPGQRQNLLLFSEFQPEADIAAYTLGRIFHAHGELRWERQEREIQVVYTGDRAYAPALNDSKEEVLYAHNAVTRSYLLFGKRLDAEQLQR
ncbi:MAG: hypothetical protein M3Z08_14145, partial [Chloroflexota bacterium]|nr:hypothetical protein [Chloroflexota bacterium]